MSIKRNVKVQSIVLTAVFAVSAVAAVAAQASAPHWTVVGAPDTTIIGVNHAYTATNTGNVTLNIPPLGIELTSTTSGDCTAGGFILGSPPGTRGTGSVELTCKNVETSNVNCKASSENENMHGLAASEGGISATLVWLVATGDAKVGVLLESKPSEPFAQILLTDPNEKCPVSGTYSVTGCTIVEAMPVTQDLTEGKFIAPATAIKDYWTNQTPTRTKDTCTGLKFGSFSATITGTFDAKLNSDKTFGIEPG